jgi:predicted DNA-binding transcriptional regulator AlpA
MGSKSIDEWCRTHSLSRSYFYVLQKRGQAPRIFRVGKCVRIADEANAEWIAARSAASVSAPVTA